MSIEPILILMNSHSLSFLHKGHPTAKQKAVLNGWTTLNQTQPTPTIQRCTYKHSVIGVPFKPRPRFGKSWTKYLTFFISALQADGDIDCVGKAKFTHINFILDEETYKPEHCFS